MNAPVTVCGNAAARASGSCTTPSGPAGGGSGSGDVNAPVTTPVAVCGNGVGLLGGASSRCGSARNGGTPPTGTSTTGGRGNAGAQSGSGTDIHVRDADTDHALASTGVDSVGLGELAAMVLLGGLALLFGGRRRQV